MKHHSVTCRNKKSTSCNFKSADAFQDQRDAGIQKQLDIFFGGGVWQGGGGIRLAFGRLGPYDPLPSPRGFSLNINW